MHTLHVTHCKFHFIFIFVLCIDRFNDLQTTNIEEETEGWREGGREKAGREEEGEGEGRRGEERRRGERGKGGGVEREGLKRGMEGEEVMDESYSSSLNLSRRVYAAVVW